jgi:hypothetical protein
LRDYAIGTVVFTAILYFNKPPGPLMRPGVINGFKTGIPSKGTSIYLGSHGLSGHIIPNNAGQVFFLIIAHYQVDPFNSFQLLGIYLGQTTYSHRHSSRLLTDGSSNSGSRLSVAGMGYRTGVNDINISFPVIIYYFVALPDKFFFQLFAFYLVDFAAQGAKCHSHYNLPF